MEKKLLMRCVMLIISMETAWVLGGCGTVGKNFNESRTTNIANGITTQAEIKIIFGEPFKTGIQNGQPIWVYEHNRYNLINDDAFKDLVIVFGRNGVVQSHQFMTSEPTP